MDVSNIKTLRFCFAICFPQFAVWMKHVGSLVQGLTALPRGNVL